MTMLDKPLTPQDGWEWTRIEQLQAKKTLTTDEADDLKYLLAKHRP